MIQEIKLQNERSMFVEFSRYIVRSGGFAWFQLTESIIQILQSKRGVDRGQMRVGGGNRNWRVVRGIPKFCGLSSRQMF